MRIRRDGGKTRMKPRRVFTDINGRVLRGTTISEGMLDGEHVVNVKWDGGTTWPIPIKHLKVVTGEDW